MAFETLVYCSGLLSLTDEPLGKDKWWIKRKAPRSFLEPHPREKLERGGGGGGRIVITDKRVLQCLTNLLFIIHMKFHQNLGKGNYKGMIHQRSVLVYPFTSKLIITNFK